MNLTFDFPKGDPVMFAVTYDGDAKIERTQQHGNQIRSRTIVARRSATTKHLVMTEQVETDEESYVALTVAGVEHDPWEAAGKKGGKARKAKRPKTLTLPVDLPAEFAGSVVVVTHLHGRAHAVIHEAAVGGE